MSAVGLTNTDLSDHENLVQARHELRRADTATSLAAWADRWGEAALDEIQDPSCDDDELEDLRTELAAEEARVGELNDELKTLEGQYDALEIESNKARDLVGAAILKLRGRIVEMHPDARTIAMTAILDELEAAL